MSLQLNHNDTHLNPKKHSLILICDGMDSPANVGGLFRLSDALGIEAVYFCRNMPDLTSVRLKRTSRNTHKKIPNQFFETTAEAIAYARNNNYKTLALEITTKSTPINAYKNSADEKIALVIGNEKHGIQEPILDSINTHLHIEMYGKNSSMNVVQAASIACYSLTKF